MPQVFHSFPEYLDAVEQLVNQKATSGPQQTEALIDFTRLNLSRMKRVYKTFKPSETVLETLRGMASCTLTLLTEAWCGDAAQTTPVIARLAEAIPNCRFSIVYRDENLSLMDRFLTNGSRSIPMLILEDSNGNVVNHWGPRPAALQHKFMEGKNAGTPKAELQLMSQEWYNSDKGKSTEAELATMLSPLTFQR